MMGTVVNVVAVIIGSCIGLAVKKLIRPNIETVLFQMLGLAVVVIGLVSTATAMITVNSDGTLSSNGGILLIASLVIGGIVGELLRIEDHLTSFGQKIEQKVGTQGFARGFVTASVLFCVGAMSIVGALNDGLSGDSSTLFLKSTLDFCSSIFLSASLGIGVLFSFVPVFLYQGAISICASFVSPFITSGMLTGISVVGNVLIAAIGLNMLGVTKMKVANALPALLIPIVVNLLLMLKTM